MLEKEITCYGNNQVTGVIHCFPFLDTILTHKLTTQLFKGVVGEVLVCYCSSTKLKTDSALCLAVQLKDFVQNIPLFMNFQRHSCLPISFRKMGYEFAENIRNYQANMKGLCICNITINGLHTGTGVKAYLESNLTAKYTKQKTPQYVFHSRPESFTIHFLTACRKNH